MMASAHTTGREDLYKSNPNDLRWDLSKLLLRSDGTQYTTTFVGYIMSIHFADEGNGEPNGGKLKPNQGIKLRLLRPQDLAMVKSIVHANARPVFSESAFVCRSFAV